MSWKKMTVAVIGVAILAALTELYNAGAVVYISSLDTKRLAAEGGAALFWLVTIIALMKIALQLYGFRELGRFLDQPLEPLLPRMLLWGAVFGGLYVASDARPGLLAWYREGIPGAPLGPLLVSIFAYMIAGRFIAGALWGAASGLELLSQRWAMRGAAIALLVFQTWHLVFVVPAFASGGFLLGLLRQRYPRLRQGQ